MSIAGWNTQTILQEYRQREAAIKKEADERDKVSAGELRELEKQLKGIRAQLDQARVSRASAMADYMTIEDREAAKVAARLQESEPTVDKVKADPSKLRDYLEKGLSESGLQKRAAAEAADKLKSGLGIIRDLGRQILVFERDEARCLKQIYYHQAEPATLQIKKLKSEIEVLERAAGIVWEFYPAAQATVEEKEHALTRANGKFIASKTWDDLDLDGLRRLRFDCEIADVFLPDLEKIIQQIKDGQRVNVHLLSGLYTQAEPRLDYSLVTPEGAIPTTTSAGLVGMKK